jgi:hypothetical protein
VPQIEPVAQKGSIFYIQSQVTIVYNIVEDPAKNAQQVPMMPGLTALGRQGNLAASGRLFLVQSQALAVKIVAITSNGTNSRP